MFGRFIQWRDRGREIRRLRVVVDAACEWFEWHAAHPVDGGPFDVRDDRLYHVVARYRQEHSR